MILRTRLFTSAILFGVMVALPASAYQTTAKSEGAVRAEAKRSSAVVDTLTKGEAIEVVKCRIFWCYIEHSGPDGWVRRAHIIEPKSATPAGEKRERNSGGGGGGGGGGAGNAGGIGTAGSGNMIWAFLTGLFDNNAD